VNPITGGVSSSEALRVWIRVAVQSFGGPAGQIAVIHRIVVDEQGWLDEQRFLHALSYCMLLPGPEAQQLATYVGWLTRGVRGGLVAGCLFIAPGFFSILVLSTLYAVYRDVSVVAGMFWGLKPAVIAIVLEAVVRLRKRALTGSFSLVLALLAFVAIFVFGVPFPVIVFGAAALGWAFARYQASPPSPNDIARGQDVAAPSIRSTIRTAAIWLALWTVPVGVLAMALSPQHVLVRESVFFSKTAVVTFGGAYAVLAYVAQQAVDVFGWLGPGEMLDGLGMAETTPGPLIQVVQFVGFMGAFRNAGEFNPLLFGLLGSVVTTWVTFVPCFLFIFVGAPYVEHLRNNPSLNAALRGITAAVVGVVLNLAVWFSLHTLFGDVRALEVWRAALLYPLPSSVDLGAVAITVAAIAATFWFRLGMLTTLGGAAVIGILVHV